MALMNGYVTVWVNAFIPRTVSGYTEMISQGNYKGDTAVPLPLLARMHPLNQLKHPATGYLTDQRGFSSNQGASVRMQSAAMITLNPLQLLTHNHKSSGTTEVNLNEGVLQRRGIADMSKCWARGKNFDTSKDSLINTRLFVPFEIHQAQHQRDLAWLRERLKQLKPGWAFLVEIHGEASDPLVAGAANIDYTFTFVVCNDEKNSRVVVVYVGFIDAFPAFEAYASFNGSKKTLFQIPPPEGHTVTNLPGKEHRPVLGYASFP